MKFNYCPLCGRKLVDKYSFDEGGVPYCEFHDKMFFNTPKPCIVVAVLKEDKILLLKQSYIFENSKVLLSGYVSPGETVEETVIREVKEESGLNIDQLKYLGSEFLKEKDLIMLTFMAKYKDGILNKSSEVEWIDWIPLKEALNHMKEDIIGQNIVRKVLKELGY
ncbi:NUDIX domain-containing protein [Clostridium niameyense]|uniref:NAD(+) diphosphatase n=1 Tax=Clostridium niameyense TaxID=1622073 RepID=A0A6M0RCF8_9CLOT|nr:NUDIX domain-containing protein [Clostridium niameyense]NEZ47985.1 NUDIX domain-containing protein [Clostridium niameyense]